MLKRGIDLAVSAAALLLLSPLLLAIALWIKLDSPGPVLFRQERVGRYGRIFRIFKFRTMAHAGAAPSGPQLTVAGDARITRAGRVLRRYKLDELPQLLDVLRGTMSLVGPRPEVPRYVEHYPEDQRERILSVRPGITDAASLRYIDENDLLAEAEDPEREYLEVILPSKLRHALDYADNATVIHDLKVLGLTLQTVFVPSFQSPRRLLAVNTDKLWEKIERVMSTPSPRRRWAARLLDGAAILACWHITYLFRLGFERWQPGRPWYDDAVSAGVVLAYLSMLTLLGAYRASWRYFGFDDFKRLALACLFAGLVCAVGVLMAQLVGVARAVLMLHPLFSLLALSLIRMGYRMVWEQARLRTQGEVAHRAVVLGAGEASRRLLAGIHRRDGWTVLGLLDDDPHRQGQRIAGVPVLGRIDALPGHPVLAGATHVIIALPEATPQERERALGLARATGLTVLTVPGHEELGRS